MGRFNNLKNIPTSVKIGRFILILIALLFLFFFLIIPLFAVFAQAFSKGYQVYFEALKNEDALSSIKLTLFVCLVCVPVNLIFGLAAAWLISKFKFKGKELLLTFIEIPLAVSPVIAGMIFILLFGRTGLFAPLLNYFNIKIVFAVPGILLATTFVTLPYIARELIPLMQEQGVNEEEASLTMGAGGFRTFCSITLPNIKWGLLYGVILCNARALGEFGAVSVVSGHIRGVTNTMPLQIEVLYNEYNFVSAFSLSSLLAFMAVLTLFLKSIVEWKYKKA